MFNRLLAIDAAWNGFALEIAIKGTLLLLLAACLIALLRGSSAAVRHRVWVLAFAGLLLLPLIQLLAPGLPWRVIPQNWQPEVDRAAMDGRGDVDQSAPVAPLAVEQAAKLPQTEVVESAEHASLPVDKLKSAALGELPLMPDSENAVASPPKEPADAGAHTRSTQWLSLGWLFGMVAALIPLVIGLLGNLRLRFNGRRVDDSQWTRLVPALSHRLGLRRNVTLLCGGPAQMPMTFGLLRPCIVLPKSADDWSTDRRQIVLLHELAHIKRCDVPLQLIARVAAAVYWFHPLVWWALRQMRQEREHACDDCVLQAGQAAPDYATQLLEIARTHCNRSPLLNAALSMARPSQLEGRLLAVLDHQRRRNAIGRAATIQLTAVALALVVGVGLVRPTLQAEGTVSRDDDSAGQSAQDPTKPATQMILTGTVLSPEGKPVPAATVEVVAYDYNYHPSQKDGDFEHFQTRADADGQFRFVLPRDISRPREYTQVIATADGYAPATQGIESTLARKHVEIKLCEQKVFRLQLIDTAGNPLAGIQPRLWWAFGTDAELFLHNSGARHAVTAWPKFSQSDAQGYASVILPAPLTTVELVVGNEHLGEHMLRVEVSDKTTSVALKPPQVLKGKITAADTGEPIAGAEVVLMQGPYPRIRTSPDGSYRFAIGTSSRSPYPYPNARSIIYVYPPPESPYLPQAAEWEWPKDGLGDGELSISLKRGIVVEGRVIDKRSQEPIAGTSVHFVPQEDNNPFFRESSATRSAGSDMRYLTDADGRFRLAVWPGPGYLLVRGPTLDFVHVEVTAGELYYGKRGLDRRYHHGALRLNLEPNKPPQPVTIELERGVTLRRRVVRPDGQPAAGKAYARSYLLHNDDIHSWLPPIPVENGLLEIPGFDPQRSKPIFIFDPACQCATVVSPTSEIELDDPPIRLQRFGSATFRFVDDKGKALADFEPLPILIVTPGATQTPIIQPDQPVASETIMWQNIVRPAKVPKTDSDGRVTLTNLIPSATYRVLYVGKDGDWTDDYEFTVRSGETVDVGEVVIPEHD